MIILDTNIISEPLKLNPSKALTSWWRAQDHQSLYLTSITVAELRSGVETLPNGRRKDILANTVNDAIREFKGRVLPFDEHVTATFAQIIARTKACGNQIGFADAAISAIAMINGFSVATRDIHELRGTGVMLINPFDYGI